MKGPTLQLAELAGEVAPSGDPINDEAAQPPAADLVQWIDAIALAMSAGIRVGERGMLRATAGAADRTDAALTPGRDPEVMDADEVAAFLGVDRNTVYDYAGAARSHIAGSASGSFSRAAPSWHGWGRARPRRLGKANHAGST